MASLIHDNGRTWRIQFVDRDGNRRSVRLGKTTKADAEAVTRHVEALAAAHASRQAVPRQTALWVADLGDTLHGRLAAVGLVEARVSATLGAFIDNYTSQRTDVKPSTLLTYRRVRNHLVGYFGEGRDLRSITPGEADAWRLWLLGEQNLAENTARKSASVARQLFKAAQRLRLVDENPFSDLPATVKADRGRFYFVTREEAQAVLDACPDAEWRLMFALARFGGLRCPSEVLALRWDQIDWSRDRFECPSPKTERHDGHGSRLVPIFPELLPHLREAFEQAEPGAVYCIARYRDPAANLRTQLGKIIRRAGLVAWPKLWQNLRATRATELADEFPGHVCESWLGHTAQVANRHYRMVTDDHFAKAAHNAAQQSPEEAGDGENDELADSEKTPVNAGDFRPIPKYAYPNSGRYRTRTSDPLLVRQML